MTHHFLEMISTVDVKDIQDLADAIEAEVSGLDFS
jgi:hypothetical protein